MLIGEPGGDGESRRWGPTNGLSVLISFGDAAGGTQCLALSCISALQKSLLKEAPSFLVYPPPQGCCEKALSVRQENTL